MNISQIHKLYLQCHSVNTDTRKISKDALFFALKGENFNGNIFAKNALEAGAKFAVIDEEKYAENDHYLVVDNVLETLQELATYHRDFLRIPIVALTGSNGKTTTKELINTVLSKKYKTIATKGNLNNHIGVPLTLLSMTPETEMGIVEMGANHINEIAFLVNITKPDYGYITNFGKAHLEGFGSIEGIIKGKSELYDYLNAHHKLIFVNGNDPIQLNKTEKSKRFIFGSQLDNDISLNLLACNPNVSVSYNDLEIHSQLIGAYNFPNICAAITIGKYFGVKDLQIKEAIENYIPTNNRSQIIEKGSNKIILDAYNANPSSMEAAIKNIISLPDKNKVLILGDMFELGKNSKIEHQNIVDLISLLSFDQVFLIGKNFFETKVNKGINKFATFDEFKAMVKPNYFKNSTILIKGSRGMALERTLDLI